MKETEKTAKPPIRWLDLKESRMWKRVSLARERVQEKKMLVNKLREGEAEEARRAGSNLCTTERTIWAQSLSYRKFQNAHHGHGGAPSCIRGFKCVRAGEKESFEVQTALG